jgi:hypothetical protein
MAIASVGSRTIYTGIIILEGNRAKLFENAPKANENMSRIIIRFGRIECGFFIDNSIVN